mmetsp:Transcript_173981/g.557775  ORF Transcript_173981/g.557775 Transcript_173981/m.557775 type:complete len:517 (-) Transcript_173981:112-1662(-)
MDALHVLRREASESSTRVLDVQSEYSVTEQRVADLRSVAASQERTLGSLASQREACAQEVATLRQEVAEQEEANAAGQITLRSAEREAQEAEGESKEASKLMWGLATRCREQAEASQREIDLARQRLLEAQAQRRMAIARNQAEEEAAERRFRRTKSLAASKCEHLEELSAELISETRSREPLLRERGKAAQEERGVVESLQSEVRRARVTSEATAQCRDVAEEKLRMEVERVKTCKAELRSAEEDLLHEERVRSSDFVEATDYKLVVDEAEAWVSEVGEFAKKFEELQAEEAKVAAAFASESDPAKLLRELADAEGRAAELAEGARVAGRSMDRTAEELQAQKDQSAMQTEELAERAASWKQAESEVDKRLRLEKAAEQDEAAKQANLKEDLQSLEEASEERDSDLARLCEQVDGFESERGTRRREEEAELAALRTAGRHEANEAGSKLQALDTQLGRELTKNRLQIAALRASVQEEMAEVAAFASEEAAMVDAWRLERDRHAQEAAALAAELRG